MMTIKCYNCGHILPEGYNGTIVTTFTVVNGEIIPDIDKWSTIACEVCGSQINDVIAELNTTFASLG